MRSRGLEEVVILNVDTNTLETPFDDLKRIPSDVVCVCLCLCGYICFFVVESHLMLFFIVRKV